MNPKFRPATKREAFAPRITKPSPPLNFKRCPGSGQTIARHSPRNRMATCATCGKAIKVTKFGKLTTHTEGK